MNVTAFYFSPFTAGRLASNTMTEFPHGGDFHFILGKKKKKKERKAFLGTHFGHKPWRNPIENIFLKLMFHLYIFQPIFWFRDSI
jgi:hypothetical protein